MAEEYVLQMCNISKSFGGTYACSNVNFNVSPGTVHALLGENGAGKSTLMKVLGGVHAADSGEIYISGQKVKIDSVQNPPGTEPDSQTQRGRKLLRRFRTGSAAFSSGH